MTWVLSVMAIQATDHRQQLLHDTTEGGVVPDCLVLVENKAEEEETPAKSAGIVDPVCESRSIIIVGRMLDFGRPHPFEEIGRVRGRVTHCSHRRRSLGSDEC
jgi:hypothetical protein